MRRPTILLLAALVVALLAPTAASASCAFDETPLAERMDDFPYVFKGRVIGLRDDDRTARFAVDEVWVGTLGPETVVHGGPVQDAGFGQSVATSVDRTWEGGATYLVFAGTEERGLVDNSCSPTRVWSDDLAGDRPADWSAPDPALNDGGDDGIGMLGVVALLAVAGLALAATGASAARRRRVA